MIRPPPISTLFPYTPLFRSDLRADVAQRPAWHEAESAVRPPARRSHPRRVLGRGAGHQPGADLQDAGDQVRPEDPVGKAEQPGDRKSTRLNSSHANISYAVF